MLQDDTNVRWDDIRAAGPNALLDNLLDAQRACEQPKRDFTLATTLDCLAVQDTPKKVGIKSDAAFRLRKIRLACHNDYVALSYTWNASSYENEAAGSYVIIDEKTGVVRPLTVRDEILNRVLIYAIYNNVSKF